MMNRIYDQLWVADDGVKITNIYPLVRIIILNFCFLIFISRSSFSHISAFIEVIHIVFDVYYMCLFVTLIVFNRYYNKR